MINFIHFDVYEVWVHDKNLVKEITEEIERIISAHVWHASLIYMGPIFKNAAVHATSYVCWQRLLSSMQVFKVCCMQIIRVWGHESRINTISTELCLPAASQGIATYRWWVGLDRKCAHEGGVGGTF